MSENLLLEGCIIAHIWVIYRWKHRLSIRHIRSLKRNMFNTRNKNKDYVEDTVDEPLFLTLPPLPLTSLMKGSDQRKRSHVHSKHKCYKKVSRHIGYWYYPGLTSQLIKFPSRCYDRANNSTIVLFNGRHGNNNNLIRRDSARHRCYIYSKYWT